MSRIHYKDAILSAISNSKEISTSELFKKINEKSEIPFLYSTFRLTLSLLQKECLIYNVRHGYWRLSNYNWSDFDTIAPCNKKLLDK